MKVTICVPENDARDTVATCVEGIVLLMQHNNQWLPFVKVRTQQGSSAIYYLDDSGFDFAESVAGRPVRPMPPGYKITMEF